MLKSRCALLFLLFPCAAAAQYPGDEYYPYAEREERRELLTTDSTIFYRAVQSPSDLYGLRTGFNLPQVALRRRGLDYTLERTSLMGVAVSYRYLAALRLLGAEEQRYAGLAAAPGEPAAAGGMRAFRFSDGEPLQPFLASVRFTDRNYLVGAKAAVSASPGDGWRISAALDARSGRDMHVEGVFTNAVTAGLRLARRFGEGHELSVLCIVPPSVRGTRLSSSEEAFMLTGDRLYNPAWGWQDGRVRNSRVRRETVPLALAAVDMTAFMTHAPHLLSGGQKQRVAIAGVIAMEPACIVLDEATAMLDPIGRQEVLSAVHKLNREKGITVVLITHHMNEAEEADRVIVMDDGRIALDGTPKEVFTQVEPLRTMGLTVPDTVDLLDRLRKDGLDVPLDALTVDECAAAITAALAKN